MHHTEALKQWRERHALTQEQAARIAMVALSTYRAWESTSRNSNGPGALFLQRFEHTHPGLFDLLKRERLHVENAREEGATE